MGTVPTGSLERDLRKLFVSWVNTLPQNMRKPDAHLDRFKQQSLSLISKQGGQIARLGVSAGFPAPKELELNLVSGHIYDKMQLAVIRAQMMTGLNSRESSKALLRAGVQQEYYKLERLARTETVRAYWQNQRNEADDLGLVLVWSVENGPRTCQWCIDRDGMVVEDGVHDHPNGRCTLLPMLPKRVHYHGSVSSDGSIYEDPDWDKRFAEPTTLGAETAHAIDVSSALVSSGSDVAVSDNPFSDDEISAGMTNAENERLALRSKIYDQYGDYVPGLDDKTMEAWQSYIGGGYSKMNLSLRDPEEFARAFAGDDFWASKYLRDSDTLSEFISGSTISQDITVARGLTVAPSFDPATLQVGQTFADAGFLSTTSSIKQAQQFADGLIGTSSHGGDGWMFFSKAPKGTNAVVGHTSQGEIIFGPGQLQRVVAIDAEKRTVYTEFIPGKSAKAMEVLHTARTTSSSVAEKVTAPNPRVIKTMKDMDSFGSSMVDPTSISKAGSEWVSDYVAGSAYQTNAVLRGQTEFLGRKVDARAKAYVKKTTKAADDLFDHSLVPEDVRVVRTMKIDGFGGETDLTKLVGTIYKDKGYMSTSLADKVSNSVYSAGEDAVDLEITVPKGTRALFLAGKSFLRSERELLLDRGSSLAIQSVEFDQRSKKWKVVATVVPGPR